ncbi:hypothetical protein [Nocardia arthritidis]|uniref:Uncharacterized protein n=1 Tax=Nocardia arthritidis TaxID=228602 RepID=A0A6G9Y9C2_9NOCA|nr:hypothetical protein [Nocardia arthritidis]QIS09646.1 hypothetical protein F5544_08720 [Nocardia arthritidis]
MGELVIDWQVYYEAAMKCHALAADLRVADKPVHDAVKGECAGMAGDAPGCEQWGKAYDSAAQTTMQTCTNLADALTNLGYMLYAAGYNWAHANKSKPMPHRPKVVAMSEYKVSIPTSVGKNGNGVTEGDGSVPGFYDALVGKIQQEFGHDLPNGHKDKLEKATSTWKTFSEHATITGAAGRITEIINLFDVIKDKSGGLDALLGHLNTTKDAATQLAAATVNVAAPVGEYSTATSEVRTKFKDAVTNALIAAGATVVIGIAATWITAALSDVAAGAGVVVIAGNTARVLKSAWDTSKLIKIIGSAAAVAGATAAAVTAFKDVDLTQEATKLAGIILMKVFIDEAEDGEIDENDPAYNFEGTGYSMEELAEFARGHAGDDNPAMGRPSLREIEDALQNGKKSPGSGNSVRYDYNGVRVIVNRDVPWKSTTYYPSR